MRKPSYRCPLAGPLSALMIAFLGMTAAACDGLGDDGDGGVTDGGAGDGGSEAGGGDAGSADAAPARKFTTIVIYDKETAPMCSAGTGPGADIDAVELRQGTALLGVGKIGTAAHGPGPAGATPCTGCGASAGACMHSGAAAVARIEGPRDGRSYSGMPDTGYIALNTATVSVQIGDATGAGPAQDIVAGQIVRVHEVDQIYKDDGSAFAACLCEAEKYQVWAFVDPAVTATAVQLEPLAYDAKNAAACGGTTPTTKEGCGTTDFRVPMM